MRKKPEELRSHRWYGVPDLRAFGHRSRLRQFGYDAAGRSVTSTDPNNHTSTTVYDDADRVIATVDPLTHRTSYGYDAAGNQVTLTDPRGNVTTTVYDELNRAVATVDPS